MKILKQFKTHLFATRGLTSRVSIAVIFQFIFSKTFKLDYSTLLTIQTYSPATTPDVSTSSLVPARTSPFLSINRIMNKRSWIREVMSIQRQLIRLSERIEEKVCSENYQNHSQQTLIRDRSRSLYVGNVFPHLSHLASWTV